MDVSYQRNLNHNYMIMENDRITGEEYTIRMVEQNQIAELLPFQVRKIDGKTYLYYEITSRQSILQFYHGCALRRRDIAHLLEGIRAGLEKMHQFLLSSEDLVLLPEFVFMDVDTMQIKLSYMPYSGESGEGGQETFRQLAEYILKNLDHSERGAVDLGYELYAQAARENFSLEELWKELPDQENRMEDGEKYGEKRYREDEANDSRRTVRKTVLEKDVREKGGSGQHWNEMEDREEAERKWRNSKDRYLDLDDTEEWERQEERKKRKHSKEREIQKNESTGQEAQKRKNGQERGTGNNGKKYSQDIGKGREHGKGSILKNILLCAAAATVGAAVFAAVVWFGKLDLTQTGGLAFLCLAVIWIGYNVWSGKGQKKRIWPDDGEEEENEEEAFMRALMSEVYEQEENAWDYDRETKGAVADGMTGYRAGRKGHDLSDRPQKQNRMTEPKADNPYQEEEIYCGETQCLTEGESMRQLRLISQAPEKYPDLETDQADAVLGKKKDCSDLWIQSEAVSRMHARIEQNEEGCFFITDLNSMNGTFINGDRLKPNEQREIRSGDRISIANHHYRVKIREF